MAVMGRYCKAYYLSKLREFPGWTELPMAKANAADQVNGSDDHAKDYLFLQENYTVTRGIFLDEEIVFDRVSPEWKEFCENILNFKNPDPVAVNE